MAQLLKPAATRELPTLPNLVFASRWLQLPLYLGLILAQAVYAFHFWVIVGGYKTFVSRMQLEGHPDQPGWLSHVNTSVLKVKLATAIIGISLIHLLKVFTNAGNYEEKVLIWQTVIHIAFLFSALAIALADRLMAHTPRGGNHKRHQRHTPFLSPR